MQGQALPGFRDFYPEELALRNHIFDTWREVARRYGFEEYDGPPLEPLELYTQKSGDEIVEQLYAFKDKGGRDVALRPEMTPTLARMIGARAQALKKPIRWFSMPQLFRYERQQRGRLREHFQLNMDIIGEPGPLADAELVAAAIDIVRAFGFSAPDFRARISDRRALSALLVGNGIPESKIPGVSSAIDKLGRRSVEDLAEHLLDLLGSKELVGRVFHLAKIRGLDQLRSELFKAGGAQQEGTDLLRCLDALKAMGLSQYVEVDLSVVRGLAYYTGIVFELFDSSRSLRAICGGGRYDKLIGQLTGVDLPCAGFGMGDVVLGELIKERSVRKRSRRVAKPESRLDAFLVAITPKDERYVLRLARQMRQTGLAVEYGLHFYAIRKQFELAVAHGAPRAVIIGPVERSRRRAVVRDLRTGKEKRVALARIREGQFK